MKRSTVAGIACIIMGLTITVGWTWLPASVKYTGNVYPNPDIYTTLTAVLASIGEVIMILCVGVVFFTMGQKWSAKLDGKKAVKEVDTSMSRILIDIEELKMDNVDIIVVPNNLKTISVWLTNEEVFRSKTPYVINGAENFKREVRNLGATAVMVIPTNPEVGYPALIDRSDSFHMIKFIILKQENDKG